MAKKSTSSAYGTELLYPNMRSNHPVRSRYMAAVLAIVLGIVGAHHFYLNNIIRGILMIVFSAACVLVDTLGLTQFRFILIPVIISVFTGFVYLIKSDVKFAKSNHIRII